MTMYDRNCFFSQKRWTLTVSLIDSMVCVSQKGAGHLRDTRDIALQRFDLAKTKNQPQIEGKSAAKFSSSPKGVTFPRV